MKGAFNYFDGVTVSLLVSMKISKTINVVDYPFDIFIETSKLTVTPPM
jgi:hypothetical protein